MKRRWFFSAFAGLFMVILSLAFLPKIASTRIGKRLFLRSIESHINGTVSAESMELSWWGPQKFTELHIQNALADIQVDDFLCHMSFWSSLHALSKNCLTTLRGPLEVKNAHIEFHPEGFPEILFEHLHAKVEHKKGIFHVDIDFYTRSKGVANIGKCYLHGYFSPICHMIKHRSIDRFSCDLQWHAKRLPSRFFDFFLGDKYAFFRSIFGSYTSLEGTVFLKNGTGNTNWYIDSSNLKTQLSAYIEKNQMRLSDTLDMHFYANPTFNQLLLKDIHPFFQHIASSSFPVRLSIPKKDFILPMNVKDISLKNARLDLGKITCYNQGLLKDAVHLVKNGTLFKDHKLDVWFTPLYFSVKDGVVQSERMDVLIGDLLHFFIWGDVDFWHNQTNMTLAVDSASLKQALSIKDLPNDFVFTVPVAGSQTSPHLEDRSQKRYIEGLLTQNKEELQDLYEMQKKQRYPQFVEEQLPWSYER